MNMYLITQDVNNDYDTYDSAVVVAKDAQAARNIKVGVVDFDGVYSEWASPDNVKAKLIGTTTRKRSGIILKSFNAG